jgi:OmpA-OmpF porin, OOP family
MNKYLGILALSLLGITETFGQETPTIQPQTFGVHYTLTDFTSARRIRSSSLSSVLQNKQLAKLKEMATGLAVSYGKGLSGHWDFVGTLAGSVLDYPDEDGNIRGQEELLLEADASLRGKMFTDDYWFTPFVRIGVGASKYKGYYGAFIPVGVGVQINFFDEAYILLNSQYRISVTESSSYHFFHSIGVAGRIGK